MKPGAVFVVLAILFASVAAAQTPRTPIVRPPITTFTPPPLHLPATPPFAPLTPSTPFTPTGAAAPLAPLSQTNGPIEYYGQCPASAVPRAAQAALQHGATSPARFSECVAALTYSATPLTEACAACAE